MLKDQFQESIAKFLKDANYRILWLEALLFSVILSSLPHLWPIGCLMFVGLSWILNQHKGTLYMIYILSFVWALAALLIGYCFGGWGWATALGVLFLMCGLNIHFRDLKKPLYNDSIPENDTIEWGQNVRWNRQNLN